MFKNNLKLSIQNLLKNKVHSSINILGFAISLAAFILIALYVQYEFSFDKYHKNTKNIYRVVRDKPGGTGVGITKTSVTPAPLAPLLVNEFPEIINAVKFIKKSDALGRGTKTNHY